MKVFIMLLMGLFFASTSNAEPLVTSRIQQFTNDKVNVWETIVYPSSNQALKMHRHEHNRVLVALNDGVLKISDNQGKTHYLKLEKNKAYYLIKDPSGVLHTDENITSYPIRVLVIELK